MPQEQNYIGVAMGMDVSDLKAGLSEANKQIQLANSEFKAASSGMEDWTKSTEGLTAKVKQLGTVLNLQKSKLAGLEAEYKKVVDSQGANSEAARRLQVQINNQKSVVNKTEQEYKNYSKTLKDAKDGTIDLTKVSLKGGKAVSKMGDNAKESSNGFTVMKGAMANLVSSGISAAIKGIGKLASSIFNLAGNTREFREDMAKLDSAFKGANLSAESASKTYKTLFGIIGESDTAVEASQQIALLANSEEEVAKWSEVAAGVVGTFGDALKVETFFEAANETIKLGEATGAFTQMLEGTGASVDEFNAGLAACTTEEEKQAYMLEVSNNLLGEAGKAYNETAKDIIEAREAEANLTQALADLGAVAEPIMTILKNLAADLLKEIKPFVELIGGGLKGALEGSAGATKTLADGIGKLLNLLVEKVANTIPTILNIILQLVPQIVETLFNLLPTLLDTIVELITQIINLLGTLLPDIVSKIIEIIPILIDSLVAAIPQLIEAATTFLLAIVEAIPVLIEQLLNELPNVIQTILDAVLEAFPLLIDAAIQLFNAIIEAIPIIIQSLIPVLPTIIDTIINALIQAIPLLLDAAIELLMAIIDALPTIIKLLVKETPKIVRTIIKALLDNLPALIQASIELFMGILEAIPEINTELIKQIPTIISTIVESFLDGIPEMIKAGGNLISGLMDGMFDFDIWGSISKLGSNIVSGFKSYFGINSPSKLMKDKIGEYLGEGVGVGLLDSVPKVKKDLSKFSDFVTDNLGNIKNNLSLGTDAVGGKNIGETNNQPKNYQIDSSLTVNYNGTLSRKELRKLENDNDRRLLNKLKAGVV